MDANDMPNTTVTRSRTDYTVACICPMGLELIPVEGMLDEIHPSLPTASGKSAYTLGSIGEHNVVVAVLPVVGTNAAAAVATQLINDFPSVRFGLLVGVGGGAPGLYGRDDIRLGDVVVSQPIDTYGGVVQYDLGRKLPNGQFQRTGHLNQPPHALSANVLRLYSRHHREGTYIPRYLTELLERYPRMVPKYSFPEHAEDLLFSSSYSHQQGRLCEACDRTQAIARPPRKTREPWVHHGNIGSANSVVRDPIIRDTLRDDMHILCVEMEAAGIMDNFPCLVIRGISDYADSHKNKQWQAYAAAVAAGYMKELLMIIPAHQVLGETQASVIVTPHYPTQSAPTSHPTTPYQAADPGDQAFQGSPWSGSVHVPSQSSQVNGLQPSAESSQSPDWQTQNLSQLMHNTHLHSGTGFVNSSSPAPSSHYSYHQGAASYTSPSWIAPSSYPSYDQYASVADATASTNAFDSSGQHVPYQRPQLPYNYVQEHYPQAPHSFIGTSVYSGVDQSRPPQHLENDLAHQDVSVVTTPMLQQVSAGTTATSAPLSTAGPSTQKTLLIVQCESHKYTNSNAEDFDDEVKQRCEVIVCDEADDVAEVLEDRMSQLTAILIYDYNFRSRKQREHEVDMDIIKGFQAYIRNGGTLIICGINADDRWDDFFKYDCKLSWKTDCSSSGAPLIRSKDYTGDVFDAGDLPKRLSPGWSFELKGIEKTDNMYINESPVGRPNNKEVGCFALARVGDGKIGWFGDYFTKEPQRKILYRMLGV